MSSATSLSDAEHHLEQEQQQNGILHLSNGAIITLIVMVILTFISLLGLLGLYFLCPRRRGAFTRSTMQGSELQSLHHLQQQFNFNGINPILKLGLEDEEINRLPLLSYQELLAAQSSKTSDFPSCCAVCLAEFREADDSRIRFLPLCHHCFHPDCVDKWLRTSASCPLCRCNLLPAQDDISAELAATAILGAHEEHSDVLILTNRPLNLPPNHLS